jgi:hypothetical protein
VGQKARRLIAVEDVARVFDDACVERLAREGRLPAHANKERFAAGVREAARIFARDARDPNANMLHDEIGGLYWAAKRRLYEEAAQCVQVLSARARALLTTRGTLPSSAALLDPIQRESACATIERLCARGGRERLRSDGKGRPLWRPMLHAPVKRRNFPRRDAERNFVMWLQIAWLEATGVRAPQTARHADAGRGLGPFAGMARECLRLVGAADVDVVELINELRRRRRIMQRRVSIIP